MPSKNAHLVVIGAGPAGLMAAERLAELGHSVDVYDRMPSVARKLLIAGVGGLNLTHSEPRAQFTSRYREAAGRVGAWLDGFDADAVRAWAAGLDIETFIGSSGRVFPVDMKAAPLLRHWLRRLKALGVKIHLRHRWLGFGANGELRFSAADNEISVSADATVLALGGGSWSRLGSDGSWMDILNGRGVSTQPLRSANCGFDIDWSAHFRGRHAGAALKPVRLALAPGPASLGTQGEMVVSEHGIEGSLVYAHAARLREQIEQHGSAIVHLDLHPGRSVEQLSRALAKPRGRRSHSEQLRRSVGIDGVKAALLFEILGRQLVEEPGQLAAAIKNLPLHILRPRPLGEAISSAGGVALDAIDGKLMLRSLPGVFCAGEMLDWEAPTGGYLLTACFASGRAAADGAAAWLTANAAPATRS